jgi:hypothetical protein
LDSNPKARICGRYVSLLRHICLRAENGNPYYDAIVVIAHSQGTVITSDLFRFLKREQAVDPDLDRFFKMPKVLFTMGSPLRQLYGQRFPYLYDYGHAGADPNTLGVKKWVNYYRAGDYIGRGLWISGTDGRRQDRCIGPGAHTHYWDHTAIDVARELDALIAKV